MTEASDDGPLIRTARAAANPMVEGNGGGARTE